MRYRLNTVRAIARERRAKTRQEKDSAQSHRGVHWSEAFVEHLRTVQFALILAAVGLVLLTSRRYDVRAASDQIDQILSLQQAWPPRLRRLSSSKLIPLQGTSRVGAMGVCDLARSWRDMVPISNAVGVQVNFSGKIYRFRFPKENWLMDYRLKGDSGGFPTTILGFERLWNAMQASAVYIGFPVSISQKGVVYGRIPIEGAKAQVPRLEMTQTDGGFDGDAELTAVGHISSSGESIGNTSEGYMLRVPPDVSLYFPLNIDCEPVTQENLARLHPNWQWKPGSFDYTFADLAEASRGHEVEDLTGVKANLAAEAGKGPEYLEIFGLKIRSNQIASAGTLLLVSIQLYFVLHLKSLFLKLRPSDPGWNIPWIGMYQDKLSRFTYLLTSVILPPGTILYLIRSQTRTTALPFSSGIVVFRLALSLLAFSLSVVLAWVCWKYRPILDTDSSAE